MSYKVDFAQAEMDATDQAKKQVAEMLSVSCTKELALTTTQRRLSMGGV